MGKGEEERLVNYGFVAFGRVGRGNGFPIARETGNTCKWLSPSKRIHIFSLFLKKFGRLRNLVKDGLGLVDGWWTNEVVEVQRVMM